MSKYQLLRGHVLDRLRELPDGSVHCVVTSPPYWGLRDYGVQPSFWGGTFTCEHIVTVENIKTEIGRGNWSQGTNGRGERQPGGVDAKRKPLTASAEVGFCQRCGAWKGCLGLEPTPELFIAHCVEVFQEVRRVLRKDGTCWLNMGDSYAAGSKNRNTTQATSKSTLNGGYGTQIAANKQHNKIVGDLKSKDIVGIPWMLAFALRSDGWWLRQDIIWSKPNPMPESITDRCTKSHEYIFLLTKSSRYFYDAEAIKEPANGWNGSEFHDGKNAITHPNVGKNRSHARGPKRKNLSPTQDSLGKFRDAQRTVGVGPKASLAISGIRYNESFSAAVVDLVQNRNKRSVWEIATEPFPEAHFATFPKKLVEPCILAGTSEKGCCPVCGAPWKRVLELHDTGTKQKMADGWDTGKGGHGTIHRDGRENGESGKSVMSKRTIGWERSCNCGELQPVPCCVLDPFNGSGTTGVVALANRCNYIGIELNEEYADMSQIRLDEATSQGILI